VSFSGNSPSGLVFPDGGLPVAGVAFSASWWMQCPAGEDDFAAISWGDVGADSFLLLGSLLATVPPSSLSVVNQTGAYSGNVSVAVDAWVHCCVTFSGAVFRFYVDGQAAGSLFGNTDQTLQQGGFGQLCGNQTFLMSGLLTDVRLFAGAISASDVETLWNGGVPQTNNTVAGLLRWWPFSEGSGSTVREVVAGANATIVGGGWSGDYPGVA
jgi:Concanavalin A-like lectin/glucanases superfamily